jgi:hypothetical protein
MATSGLIGGAIALLLEKKLELLQLLYLFSIVLAISFFVYFMAVIVPEIFASTKNRTEEEK